MSNTQGPDIKGAIQDIRTGGRRDTWFGIRNIEWEKQIKAYPDKYKGINPLLAYARKVLREAFEGVIRDKDPYKPIQSVPEHEKVLNWAVNNDRKGLFLIGNCGTGKTATIEALYRVFYDGLAMWYESQTDTFVPKEKIFSRYTATDLLDNSMLDEALSHRFVIVDDIGTEAETSIRYGQRRNPIAELIDNAERKDCLLLMTSNLSPQEFYDKYGARTADRIKALCTIIQFRGDSFRGVETTQKNSTNGK